MSTVSDTVLSVIGRPQARDRRTVESQRRRNLYLRCRSARSAGCRAGVQHDRERPPHVARHRDAEAMPGVHAVLHRGNIGRFYRLSGNSMDDGLRR